MKKLLASILATSMLLSGCAGGGNDEPETEIYLVTDSGDVNDKSFNQSAWEATQAFADEKNVGCDYIKPATFNDKGYADAIELAVDQGAKAIVLPGFKFENAIVEAQKENPEVKFILIDAVPKDTDPAENTYCALYSEQQSGYLAGYAAVKEGLTKLGFMGGIQLPAVKNFGFGYVQGARDAAKELGKKITIDYTYTGTFNESPEIKTQAATWYNKGTEVIFACGGAICNSVFAAAEEAGAKSIGVDSDQKDASETVMTSAMKDVFGTVKTQLAAIYDETFKGGTYVLGASEDAVKLSDDFSRFSNFKQEEYKALFERIKAGEVEIKSSADVADPTEFNDDSVTVTVY